MSSLLIAIFFAAFTLFGSAVWGENLRGKDIRELLDFVRTAPPDEVAPEKIVRDGEVLICTGDGTAALLNNEGAEYFKDGQYQAAIELFLQGLRREGLFLPYQYNIGLSYYYLGDLDRALVHFRKARDVAPFYSKTWIRIGKVYERQGKVDNAVEMYREALLRNSKELDVFVYIGDIYFYRNQFNMAERYYEAALKLDRRFPNALIGKARVLFMNEKFIQSQVLLRQVDTTGEYDKALHYYYAEASFKLRDYRTAVEQYEKLLTFRTDPFFLMISRSLIEHKLNLSRRFIID